MELKDLLNVQRNYLGLKFLSFWLIKIQILIRKFSKTLKIMKKIKINNQRIFQVKKKMSLNKYLLKFNKRCLIISMIVRNLKNKIMWLLDKNGIFT